MRRVTVTIEEVGTGSTGKASVSTESNTYGNGAVTDHIAAVTQKTLEMWTAVDPQSAKPRLTGHPHPAPGRPA